MRINKFIAAATMLSRRSADAAIAEGRVLVNGAAPEPGQQITSTDSVTLDNKPLDYAAANEEKTTIILNKPVGYVCSRNGQGSKTIYDLLPPELHQLNPVGRLDKDSSGLLLMTNDGQLAQELTHPSHQKTKIYEIKLNKPLQPLHQQMISDFGLQLYDGLSKLQLERLHNQDDKYWRVTMQEGRNRQIRRTFAALNYNVQTLHRTHFGPYAQQNLTPGHHVHVDKTTTNP